MEMWKHKERKGLGSNGKRQPGVQARASVGEERKESLGDLRTFLWGSAICTWPWKDCDQRFWKKRAFQLRQEFELEKERQSRGGSARACAEAILVCLSLFYQKRKLGEMTYLSNTIFIPHACQTSIIILMVTVLKSLVPTLASTNDPKYNCLFLHDAGSRSWEYSYFMLPYNRLSYSSQFSLSSDGQLEFSLSPSQTNPAPPCFRQNDSCSIRHFTASV